MQRVMYTFSIVALTLVGGCGRSATGPETAAVSGTVYLNGAPAADVEVNFFNGGSSSFGRTDAEGKYELVSGAAVGENQVYFSKITGTNFELNPAAGMDEGQLLAMRDPGVHPSRRPKQLIPEPYSDPTKTKVRFVVPSAGATNADFKLQTR